jgi:hypothetical protein
MSTMISVDHPSKSYWLEQISTVSSAFVILFLTRVDQSFMDNV